MKNDSIITGILVTLVTIAISVAIIAGVFFVLGLSYQEYFKIFILSFVAPVLLLRYYTKKLRHMRTAMAMMITLFITMIPFLIILVRSNLQATSKNSTFRINKRLFFETFVSYAFFAEIFLFLFQSHSPLYSIKRKQKSFQQNSTNHLQSNFQKLPIDQKNFYTKFVYLYVAQ